MPLQIRRGTAAERNALSSPLVIGELIYVTDQGKLYIGDGTPLGGADSLGTPGQGGKGLIITGFTSEEAQDAMANALANGTHSNIVFTYDDTANAISAALDLGAYSGNVAIDGILSVTGNLQAAAFKGSIFADDSTLLVDAVSGSIPYSVISGTPTALSDFTNDVGYIRVADIADGTVTVDVNNTGDLVGSVYGDDSTLLVDATSSTIPASVVIGTFTGDVVGNVNGNLTGDVSGGTVTGSIVTSLISSADSGTIFIESPAAFRTTLRVESQLVVEDEGIFYSTDATQFPLSINAAHEDDLATTFTIRKSRGEILSPTTLIDQDRIGTINFSGHDGTTFVTAASIQAKVTGTTSTGIVPASLRFFTMATDGSLNEVAAITDFGAFNAYANNSATSPIAALSFHDDGTNASNLLLQRTRGTRDVPTSLQSGDPVFDLSWGGYDGAAYRPVAQIRASVNGTVSSGVVPGKLDFYASSSTGTSAVRISMEATKTTFNNVPVLPTYANETAAGTAVGTPVNGMMYYDSGASKIKAFAGGVWVALH